MKSGHGLRRDHHVMDKVGISTASLYDQELIVHFPPTPIHATVEQRVPHTAIGEGNSPTHETTPLLQPSSQSDNGCKCCVVL